MSAKVIYVDAGCRHNGMDDATGIIAIKSDDLLLGVKEYQVLPNIKIMRMKFSVVTNNICEVMAVRCALDLITSKDDDVTIVTDSELAHQLVNLQWQCKTPNLAMAVLETVRQMRKKTDDGFHVFLMWRPRQENLAGVYIEDKYGL